MRGGRRRDGPAARAQRAAADDRARYGGLADAAVGPDGAELGDHRRGSPHARGVRGLAAGEDLRRPSAFHPAPQRCS